LDIVRDPVVELFGFDTGVGFVAGDSLSERAQFRGENNLRASLMNGFNAASSGQAWTRAGSGAK